MIPLQARLLWLLPLALPASLVAVAHCGARLVDAVDRVATTDDGGVSMGADVGTGMGAEAGTGADTGTGLGIPWPNSTSSTNSDPWIAANHDAITEMHPRLLVLDFYNPILLAEAQAKVQEQIDAIAEGSKYHGYSDGGAPAFLQYDLTRIVDLTDHPPPANWYVSSTKLPVDSNGNFDTGALFAQSFALNYGVPDPTNPSRDLMLCELFEQGIINELWLIVGDRVVSRKPGLLMESKQVYNAQNQARAGVFNSCTGYMCLPASIPHCNVTARIAHLDPTILGPGCDLVPRTMGMENMRVAIPYLQDNASDFFNDRFTAHYQTNFNSWAELVAMGGASGWCTQQGPACISYPTPTVATGSYPDGGTWKMDPFVQGCGTAHFPPNARSQWDATNSQRVQSRCENYSMHNGPGATDIADVYTSAKETASAPQSGDDCAGGWQIYLRQNIPGYHNTGYASDGTPMKNWWPFLFY